VNGEKKREGARGSSLLSTIWARGREGGGRVDHSSLSSPKKEGEFLLAVRGGGEGRAAFADHSER